MIYNITQGSISDLEADTVGLFFSFEAPFDFSINAAIV